MPAIRITVDGKLALTVEQLAERYGVKVKSMSVIISRLGEQIEPITFHLDNHKKVYLAVPFDRIMKAARPGRGANLRGPRATRA